MSCRWGETLSSLRFPVAADVRRRKAEETTNLASAERRPRSHERGYGNIPILQILSIPVVSSKTHRYGLRAAASSESWRNPHTHHPLRLLTSAATGKRPRRISPLNTRKDAKEKFLTGINRIHRMTPEWPRSVLCVSPSCKSCSSLYSPAKHAKGRQEEFLTGIDRIHRMATERRPRSHERGYGNIPIL